MPESHYEINVSHNGRHLFATAPRSGVRRDDAERVFVEICNRFPKAEGFEVTVTYWDCVGRVQAWYPPAAQEVESGPVIRRVVDNALDSSRRAAKRKR